MRSREPARELQARQNWLDELCSRVPHVASEDVTRSSDTLRSNYPTHSRIHRRIRRSSDACRHSVPPISVTT